MKVTIAYRCVDTHAHEFVVHVLTKKAGRLGVFDKTHAPVLIVRSGKVCRPAEEQVIEFDWALQGHPSDYVWKAAVECSCKFQLREFSVDGLGMLHRAEPDGSVGPVMQGRLPPDQGMLA